jgi:23S rRNA (cytosine1962-C5)-methyltransferase
MSKVGRPKLRENRAGDKPGERQFNAAPGIARRDKKPRGKVFTKARGRDEDEGPTPIDPVPWEMPGEVAETPRSKRSKSAPRGRDATTTPKSKPSKLGPSNKAQGASRPSEPNKGVGGKAPVKPVVRTQDGRDNAEPRKVERAPERKPEATARAAAASPRDGIREAPRAKPLDKRARAEKTPVIRSGSGTDIVKVKLARGKSKPFWIGHPWVFSGAIASVEGEVGQFGSPCIVEDERDNALGFGHYNPDGAIAVRLLTHRRTTDLPFEVPELSTLLDTRLAAALALRTAIGLPADDTDVYRLVNADGDFLPGLVVDRLGDVTSVQFGSRQMYDLREAIVGKLARLLPTSRTVVTVTETSSRLEGLPMMSELEPELQKKERALIEVKERGLRYVIDLEHLQKTGFYADQRENRQRFAALCAGRSVLDAYCHVGGFGLQAAKAGASRVVQVDSSNVAIDGARAAAELNGLSGVTEALVADAIVYLKEAQAAGRTFDRIVVDPPKFAQGRSHLEDALQKYARLNTLAMATLSEGGLLLTNSCSGHVGEDEFGRMLTESGHRLRKSVRVLERWGQPADHPTLSVAPEGRYLKSWLVSIGD